jgi:hypothetical protein
MMAFPSQPSNQKWCACLAKTPRNRRKIGVMSIFYLLVIIRTPLTGRLMSAESPPPAGQEHEFEEFGVNRYTAPSIAQIFKQLDELKPLSFDQLKCDIPQAAGATREQKGLIFGELIADGLLLVEAEKKNLIENFGRVLTQQARARCRKSGNAAQRESDRARAPRRMAACAPGINQYPNRCRTSDGRAA